MVINISLSFWPNNIVSDVTDDKPELNIERKLLSHFLSRTTFLKAAKAFEDFFR